MKSFFLKKGPFDINFLISKTKFTDKKKYNLLKIKNIATLSDADMDEISFFDNIKYLKELNSTNASCVLIKHEHVSLLKKNILPIISSSPLLDFILISKIFYPEASFDDNEIDINYDYKEYENKNIIIDKSVKIGKNVKIGANTTIKKNVIIGNNVSIGSNCVISNSEIENEVIINDGTVIGKIGFGFKYIDNELIFIPHIGGVKIKKKVYIGSNCTIDRGSFSNTVIDEGTMIDNQVHIAHNCKVGKKCFLAGQVGIAGSSTIGDNCLIGGQSGISGHLTIGNNVYIGGGSGVLRDIENGKRVMGYPATEMKNFLKKKNQNDW